MCECGCTSNDSKYLFPAPGNKVYMLTLSGGCVDCDAPSGVTIERISKSDLHVRHKDDYTDGDLKFENWRDSEGVAIVTGMLQHEFVAALKGQLVGVNPSDLADDESGLIDDAGAETLLEEMYDDSTVKPHIVEPAEISAPVTAGEIEESNDSSPVEDDR